jgi:hypothetical protein
MGRDRGHTHHVLEQRMGPPQSLYAHKLGLRWVVVGEVCLGRTHRSEVVMAKK